MNTPNIEKNSIGSAVAASLLCTVCLIGFPAAAQLVAEESLELNGAAETQTMPALMDTENSLNAKASAKLNAQIDKATDAAVESQSQAKSQAESTARAEAGVAGDTLARQRAKFDDDAEVSAAATVKAKSNSDVAAGNSSRGTNSASGAIDVYDAEPVEADLLQEATVETPAVGAYEPEAENKDVPESNRSGLNTEVRTGLKLRFGGNAEQK